MMPCGVSLISPSSIPPWHAISAVTHLRCIMHDVSRVGGYRSLPQYPEYGVGRDIWGGSHPRLCNQQTQIIRSQR